MQQPEEHTRIAELERRVRELEAITETKGSDPRELWERMRAKNSVPELMEEFKAEMLKRGQTFSRPHVHRVVDEFLANPRGQQVTWTITFSSEPCAIVIFTAITVTLCSEEEPLPIANP